MSPILSVVPSLERAFLSLVWRSNGHNKVQLNPIKAHRIIDLVFNDPTRQALRRQFAKLTRHDFYRETKDHPNCLSTTGRILMLVIFAVLLCYISSGENSGLSGTRTLTSTIAGAVLDQSLH